MACLGSCAGLHYDGHNRPNNATCLGNASLKTLELPCANPLKI